MNQLPRKSKADSPQLPDFPVVSHTECTGLEAVPPEDRAEAEGLEEIYDLPLTGQAGEPKPGEPRRGKRKASGA